MTQQEALLIEAISYLKRNPERFTREEKNKFMLQLEDFVSKSDDIVIDDEIYDFLIDCGIVKSKKREINFTSYLHDKYKHLHFNKVMEVGAGRMCKLSKELKKFGNSMYAIDPNIRLTEREAKQIGINISKKKFICDEFSNSGHGTNIKNMDLIIGNEPCNATEHIIRQSLKYDKPFDIALCASPHDSLDGKQFSCYEDWYEYLQSISKEVEIKKFKNSYYASNSHGIGETEMER